MKKIIALLLVCALALTGCKADNGGNTSGNEDQNIAADSDVEFKEIIPDFDSLSDPALLRYVEDSVYYDIVSQLDSKDYLVEKVETVYISKEYIDELEFNSQTNIFFGYTLSELEEQFQGKKYVFTLGDDGTTAVKELEEYDDTLKKVITNVAIGSGVILLCVTVSVVTGGAGAAAVSMVFAASAKTAATFAVSSAVFGGLGAGIAKGVETGNFDEALKAAALAGSEGFKWGAITGAVVGGVGEAASLLRGAADVTANGLQIEAAAQIQKESKYPLDFIKNFKSLDQYKKIASEWISKKVNGVTSLIKKIDLDYKDISTGLTNLQRMLKGMPALDKDGKILKLLRFGSGAANILAILSDDDCNSDDEDSVWKQIIDLSGIIADELDPESESFWKGLAEAFSTS